MTEIDEALGQLRPDEERLLRARFGLGEMARAARHPDARVALTRRQRRIEAQAFRKLRAQALAQAAVND